MTSPPILRLTASLADRYRIERELGQGGMATASRWVVAHAGGSRVTETGLSLGTPHSTFVFVKGTRQDATSDLTVVLNWFAAVRRGEVR